MAKVMKPIKFNNNDQLPSNALRPYKSKRGGECTIPVVSGSLPLDMDDPWPTKDVLRKLIWATEYLLNEKNYDGHAYEQLEICVRRGKEILRAMESNDR